MRIAIVTPRFPPQGGEDYSYHMAKIATEDGHYVEVFTTGLQTSRDAYKGIWVNRYQPKMSFGEFAKLWLPNLTGFDIIHLCGGFRHPHMFWAYLTKGRAKLIISPFYPVKPRVSKVHRFMQWSLDKTMAKWVLQKADQVCVETDQEAKWLYLKMGVDMQNVTKIPNPLEDQYVGCGNPDRFRQKYNIGINGPLVFYLGGHSYIKNVTDLIETIPYVQHFHPNVMYVIGGSGPLTEQYKKRIKELGMDSNVIFPGTFFDDIQGKYDAFAAADVFVLPSLMEGLGGVLIEAMSQGTPVIASNKGGLPDVVPVPFCQYEPGNKEALKDKILEVLDNPEVRGWIITKGIEKVDSEYRYSKISKKYLQLLKTLNEEK